MKFFSFLFAFWFLSSLFGQDTYFPPLSGDAWATTDPASLGWCEDGIDDLYGFLNEKETKAFIILKDGRIVIEKYFGSFNKDSIWYWASAGKTMTSFLTGMAQEKGLLSIQDKTSKYLGEGWTSMAKDKEDKITIWNQLTMTTGLEDAVTNDNCMIPTCLTYKADAGKRWAYHNAPYRLIQNVIAKASGTTYQSFMNTQLSVKTGIGGIWYDGVLYSKPRAMARFGHLVLNKGNWNGVPVLSDQNYIQAMTTPSQSINQSYGLLWWLNGQPSFMIPDLQIVFNGSMIPNAPDETWCALGKNDQKIYIIPSKKMVIIRMGNDGGQITGAVSSFDNLLWEKINGLVCISSISQSQNEKVTLFPNPTTHFPSIQLGRGLTINRLDVFDINGQLLFSSVANDQTVERQFSRCNTGVYFVRITLSNGKIVYRKVIKN